MTDQNDACFRQICRAHSIALSCWWSAVDLIALLKKKRQFLDQFGEFWIVLSSWYLKFVKIWFFCFVCVTSKYITLKPFVFDLLNNFWFITSSLKTLVYRWSFAFRLVPKQNPRFFAMRAQSPDDLEGPLETISSRKFTRDFTSAIVLFCASTSVDVTGFGSAVKNMTKAGQTRSCS